MQTGSPLARAVACAVMIGALSGCGSDDPPAPPPAPPAVTVVTLAPRDVPISRDLPGRAVPSLIAEVRPQVSGVIRKRLFEEGSTVKAGQPLYQLDDATYSAEVESAKATLARAEATVQAAGLTSRRSGELVKIDAISRQEFEDAEAAFAQARADVLAARAELQRSQVQLGYARIVAPISGRIGKSTVTQGALVTAAQADPLVTIQQLDPMYVDLTQSSSELLALRREIGRGRVTAPGADLPVTLRLEDGTTFENPGRIAFYDVTVDRDTGSFSMRISVPNPDNVLLPGMYMRAQVGNGVRRAALLLPQQAVTRDPKGLATALVVQQDNKVALRQLTLNRAIGNDWLVDAGIEAGEKVIVEGLQKVRPGVLAQPTEATAMPPPAGATAPVQASPQS